MVDPEGSKISLTRGDLDPPYSIERKNLGQAHRTLGVRLTPNGNWSSELEFLKNKIRRFTARLRKHSLTTHKVMIAMRSQFKPSICYSSGITGFTADQCKQLQMLAHPAWLQALGYSSRYLSAVAHAPQEYGGIWMIQFIVQQGVQAMALMLGHLRAQTEVGKMIQIGIDYFRLISGRTECTFKTPVAFTAYSLQDWFMVIRNFLAETNSNIAIPLPGYLHQKCHGDVCIMDCAIPPHWSVSNVRAINRCRLYLRVLFLSDIAHGDGKHMISNGFNGIKPFDSSLIWPQQGKPSENNWRTWKRFLRREFLQPNGSYQLQTPLGTWIDHEDRHHRLWRKHRHIDGVSILRWDGWRLFRFIAQG